MTYEEYWQKDCTLVKAYRKAWKMKSEIKEWDIWKQGMYVYDALCKVSPILHAFAQKGTKPLQYPEKPYGIEQYEENDKKEEEKQQEVENERLKAQLHFTQLFKNVKTKFSDKKEGK